MHGEDLVVAEEIIFFFLFLSQDSNFPWSKRVSFAKDIAAGMVSSKMEVHVYFK